MIPPEGHKTLVLMMAQELILDPALTPQRFRAHYQHLYEEAGASEAARIAHPDSDEEETDEDDPEVLYLVFPNIEDTDDGVLLRMIAEARRLIEEDREAVERGASISVEGRARIESAHKH